MIKEPFWKYFIFLSILVALSLIGIYQIDIFKEDILLSILGFVFMVAATGGFYILSKKAIRSPNKMAFIQLVMGNVLFKLIFIMAIVATYFKVIKPETKYFVIPFLSIYFIYTIFETISIYKISNQKQE